MSIRRAIYASVLAFSGISGSAFAGGNSAGLILETTGNVPASVAPYTEVASGSDVALGSDYSTVLIAHYATCRQVDVKGGALTVNKDDYAVHDGQILSEVQQPCPEHVKIGQTTAIAGGLVMR